MRNLIDGIIIKAKLKEKINFLKYLLIATAFFILSVLFDKNLLFTQIKNQQNIDAKQIESILTKKEKKLVQVLNELTNEFSNIENQFITNDTLKHRSFDSVFFSPKFLELNNEGINVLVFYNDTIRFWTSNQIPLSIKYSDSYLGDRVVDLNNAIYRVIIQKKARYIYVGLILLKHKYSYENSLLKNTYNPDFKLDENIELSLIRENNGIYINDASKNFLFTLIPTNFSVTDKPYFYITVFFYFLSIVFFLLFINILIKKLFFFTKKDIWILFLITGMLYAKYLISYYQIPANIYFTDFYKPDIFAYSDYLPSISDFLQISIIIFLFSFNFTSNVKAEDITRKILTFSKRNKQKVKQARYIFIFGFPILLALYYHFILHLIRILIIHSTIPFEIYKILELNFFSFIGLFIIGLLVSGYVLVTYKYIYICSRLILFKGFIQAGLLYILSFIFIQFIFKTEINFVAFSFMVILLIIFTFVRFLNIFYPYYFYVFILFISTIFVVTYTDIFINQKDLEIRNMLILPAMQEQDAVAEHILCELSDKIKLDTHIAQIINSKENAKEKIKNHLFKKHYPVLWEEYDLEVNVCTSEDSIFINNLVKENCFIVYDTIINKYSYALEDSSFMFLDNKNGRISYLGVFEYRDTLKNTRSRLYLELNSKLRSQVIGFPKILIDESYYRKSRLEEYSYAKYHESQLVNQKGSLAYRFFLNEYELKNTDSTVFYTNNFQHLLKTNSEKFTVIISRKYRNFLDILVSFSYIFVFYYMLLNIVLVFNKVPFYYKELRHGLKFRIQFSMVAILFLSILTVGGLSIYYIIKQSERNYNKNVSLDLNSVINELEYEYDNYKNLDSIPKADVFQMLKKIANVFSTDIHLYSVSGDLIASSTPEIFDRELIGRKISPQAYKVLHIEGENYFTTDEKLAQMEYLAVYAKLFNINKKNIAYINIPFFAKEKILQEEVSNFVVTVINFFALLLLIAIVIAIFISNKIVQPLRLIQTKFSEVRLGKTNEQILYTKDDEIGGLIKEYNRMLVELAKSAEMLGKSEREGAWREMAKQIAHEIKNPLTPMKLSLQLLKRSWNDDDPQFPMRIESISDTLIEQIDRLSSIATSFSNFAKIPSAQNKKFNIRLTLERSITLYENFDDLVITSNISNIYDDVYIFADEEQISRALINLIKNAHQAKKKNIDSFIHIEFLYNDKRMIIKIIDNGTGIPEHIKEHLFTPNFTTKTSGMGLGLSIVKNIIENANGKVWFETEINIGTTFNIELPVFQEEKKI